MWPSFPKRGFSLTTALMVLVICMALTVAGLRQMAGVKGAQVRRLQSLKATWAAESGMAHALRYLGNIQQWGELGGIDGKRFTWPSDQSAVVEVTPLMGYARITVLGSCGSQQYKLEALAGQKPGRPGRFSLAIAEGPQPFFTSGQTRIEGDVSLPGGKLESKALHGAPASNMPVIQGRLSASRPGDMPPSSPFDASAFTALISQARTIITTPPVIPDSPIWDLEGRTWRFAGDLTLPTHTLTIRGPGEILVSGTLQIGHALQLDSHPCLVSGGDLTIDGDVTLAATVIAGGTLTISGHTKGIASLISPQGIRIGPETRFDAPSWCLLSSMSGIETTGRPALMAEGQFNGLIATASYLRTQPLVRITRQANVQGAVYCQGRLILESPFKGSIWTRQFETLQGARAFQNWLRDTQIEAPDSPAVALPFGFGEGARIVGWFSR